MRKTALLLAATGCLLAVPALGGTPSTTDRPIVVAEDFCVGPACIGPRDRYRDRDRDETRYRDRDRDCRDVTIHERHGDETVERTIRRCR